MTFSRVHSRHRYLLWLNGFKKGCINDTEMMDTMAILYVTVKGAIVWII